MADDSADTVIERLKASIEAAAVYNPNDVVAPVAILWTDQASHWQAIVPQLRQLVPHLLALGDYEPDANTGPAIWLRCVVDGGIGGTAVAGGAVPVLYLPGVGRGEIGGAEGCPAHLKPLVELQYRGVCWTQKNGKDWTVEAFLASADGGLGLDVARDAATRAAMSRALSELASASVGALSGKRLEADDFDRLLTDDAVRDVLVWLNDAAGTKAAWDAQRWGAFVSRCQADLGFHPDGHGEIDAAERLGRREGGWDAVWRRFEEAPGLYPALPELLRRAMPDLIAPPRSSWPQCNEADETTVREALRRLGDEPSGTARKAILALERTQGERRDWAWARLGLAPLAEALAHLAVVAEGTSKELGGASAAELAEHYAIQAWQVDLAALDSMAAVASNADAQAVGEALQAIYAPWLDAAARHLQDLVETGVRQVVDGRVAEPLGTRASGPHAGGDARAPKHSTEPGTVILFADGLRYDVSRRLAQRLEANGHAVAVSTSWAALPSVTATAKPACSPVADQLEGEALGERFLPSIAATKQPLSTDRFRKLLDVAGFQYLDANATGDPNGKAWTEDGQLDKLGHSTQAKLASRIEEQIALLVERIETLLTAGWREVRVVTDHGWLWLPGGLPKVDLPRYLVTTRWSRCAVIAGASQVEAPTVPWHWNGQERVAVGPGIACFVANTEYAHGGLSLQECLVPVLRVTAGAGSTAAPTIASVAWVGLRCRVRIEGAEGLAVALRTQVGNADSTLGEPKRLGEDGAASLLVADDGLVGATAAVVVLDTHGQVVARQSTIVGGED